MDWIYLLNNLQTPKIIASCVTELKQSFYFAPLLISTCIFLALIIHGGFPTTVCHTNKFIWILKSEKTCPQLYRDLPSRKNNVSLFDPNLGKKFNRMLSLVNKNYSRNKKKITQGFLCLLCGINKNNLEENLQPDLKSLFKHFTAPCWIFDRNTVVIRNSKLILDKPKFESRN